MSVAFLFKTVCVWMCRHTHTHTHVHTSYLLRASALLIHEAKNAFRMFLKRGLNSRVCSAL